MASESSETTYEPSGRTSDPGEPDGEREKVKQWRISLCGGTIDHCPLSAVKCSVAKAEPTYSRI